MSNTRNDHLVLICGMSGTGKSASLRDIVNPEGVMYLNTESGKRLPFKSKFKEYVVTDPLQIPDAFNHAETMEGVHTIIIDSLVFMMDLFELKYIVNSSNTMAGWASYSTFFKNLMNQSVANSTKNVIFTSHVMDILNDKEMSMERLIKVKGSLMNTSIEAFFSVIVAAKKIPITKLKGYENDLLIITDEEEVLGFKHVYQVKLTKDTINERIRGPMGMWDKNETYIDNCAQKLVNRLKDYYD